MSNAFSAISLLYTGTIVDLVIHAEQFADMADAVNLALDGRCRFCRYRYDHPVVRHLGVKGAECGWR